MRIVTVSAGASQPSSTRKLADRISQAVGERLPAAEMSTIDVRELGHDLLNATTSGLRSAPVNAAIAALASADAMIAVTPVFNGAYSGLFKLLFDVLDEGTLRGVPVLLAATGGTARHSLAIDQTMVPLFYYLRARLTTSPVFAATDDWAEPKALDARVSAAADELVAELSGTRAGQDDRRVSPDDDFTVPDDFASMLSALDRPVVRR